MKRALHWFRRDLRIRDNRALLAAAEQSDELVPVYILSCWKKRHRWTGIQRQQFLCESLASLSFDLEALGGKLVLREGDPIAILRELMMETKAKALFFNRDPDPFGRRIERDIEKLGQEIGFEVRAHKDVCLHERDEILNGSGKPFRVFTPYAKVWAKAEKAPPGAKLKRLRVPSGISSLPLPDLERWGLPLGESSFAAGESAARKRFRKFLDGGLWEYGKTRDKLDQNGSSRISQDLRFGLLSIREVFAHCESRREKASARARPNIEKFISELIWREFAMQVLWHHPGVLELEFQSDFKEMEWPGTPSALKRWQTGETGFPIVDAAMRQLNETGFLPNRARMITAMFLSKDLRVDWRKGEQYFMQKLRDGEIASNNAGWQWCAGTGVDAAPYFRIQNPWTQATRHDENGDYIRTWIPELRDVPSKNLFRPPESGIRLAANYPRPMVDHAEARKCCLEMFEKQKAKAVRSRG